MANQNLSKLQDVRKLQLQDLLEKEEEDKAIQILRFGLFLYGVMMP